MKRGTKLTRICATCHQRKEQVADQMRHGNGGWHCGTCLQISWEKIREKLMPSMMQLKGWRP